MVNVDWTIPAVALTLTGVILIWLRNKLGWVVPNKKKQNPAKTDDAILKSTYQKVVKLLEEDHIYLNKQIKVSDLAKEIRQSEKCISRSINKYSRVNFNAFINSFRVEHSKGLLSGGKFDHYTIEAIAEESGFANKVSFYNAFKNSTGMSPREFRELKQS